MLCEKILCLSFECFFYIVLWLLGIWWECDIAICVHEAGIGRNWQYVPEILKRDISSIDCGGDMIWKMQRVISKMNFKDATEEGEVTTIGIIYIVLSIFLMWPLPVRRYKNIYQCGNKNDATFSNTGQRRETTKASQALENICLQVPNLVDPCKGYFIRDNILVNVMWNTIYIYKIFISVHKSIKCW